MSTYLKLRNIIKLVIHEIFIRSSPIGFGVIFLSIPLKYKKFESILSNGSRDIAKSLKTSFGSSFVSFCAFGSKFWQFRFSVYTFQTKKLHSIIFTPSWVLVYITFTNGRTDIFRKSFIFSSWSRIYIQVYTYLDYFSNFTPILTKVSIPFLYMVWNSYESVLSDEAQ